MTTVDTQPGQRLGVHELLDLVAARDALRLAKERRDAYRLASAQRMLRVAVDAARDAGLGWMEIGNALGIARGNAYQQYRRRPPSDSLADSPPL